jgi:uncharacterized protein
MTMALSSALPVPVRPASGRNSDVDVMRGIALLLLFQVNLGMYLAMTPDGGLTPGNGWGDMFAAAISSFCASHAVETFSFLFGISYVLFAGTRDVAAGKRLLQRRFVGMLALGLVHGILIFEWDIVFTYGVIGLLLVWAEPKLSDRGLLVAAALMPLGMMAVLMPIILGMDDTQIAALTDPYVALFGGPDWGAFLQARLDLWLTNMPGQLFGQSWTCMTMILLGVWCGRRGLVTDAAARQRLCDGVIRWLTIPAVILWADAVITGLGADRGMESMDGFEDLSWFDYLLVPSTPLITIWMNAMLARYVVRWNLGPVRGWLESCGRMSLTGYMTHSLALIVVFTWVGFGAVGEIPRGWGHLAGIAYVMLQGIAAQWWLSRYTMGPDEWLLRSWTHGRWQRFRRLSAA